MFVATIATYRRTGEVIVIDSNESASLETMTALANLAGVAKTRRVETTEDVFVAYSNGVALTTDIEVNDGAAHTVVVPAN